LCTFTAQVDDNMPRQTLCRRGLRSSRRILCQQSSDNFTFASTFINGTKPVGRLIA
ncbi:unnamed protein product, partial [Ceratitis capitata]